MISETVGTTVAFLQTGDPMLRVPGGAVGLAGYPELELLTKSREFRDAPEEVKAYMLGLRNSGGDQDLSDWFTDFHKALKDHRQGRPLAITRDALGRPAEEDVVEDDEG